MLPAPRFVGRFFYGSLAVDSSVNSTPRCVVLSQQQQLCLPARPMPSSTRAKASSTTLASSRSLCYRARPRTLRMSTLAVSRPLAVWCLAPSFGVLTPVLSLRDRSFPRILGPSMACMLPATPIYKIRSTNTSPVGPISVMARTPSTVI